MTMERSRDEQQYCEALHQLCAKAVKFSFATAFAGAPENGLYLLFEKGELGHGTDRIVRVGTHTGAGGLKARIRQHFAVPNKNRSIFRKNIGRCMLNQEKDPYLKIWDYAIRSKEAEHTYGAEIDREKERQLEVAVTAYIRDHFRVATIRCDDLSARLRLESRLISTVSNCPVCGPGKDWFGHYSTRPKIRESGLWQVNELYKENLTAADLAYIEKHLVRAK